MFTLSDEHYETDENDSKLDAELISFTLYFLVHRAFCFMRHGGCGSHGKAARFTLS